MVTSILLAARTVDHLFGESSATPGGDDYQFLVGLQRTDSRGTLSFDRNDVSAPPRIDFHYLDSATDRERLRMAVRTAVAMLESNAYAHIFAGLSDLQPEHLADDDALDAWLIAHMGTAIHMCGTAPMGPVTDASGRVHGIAGLYVADTSILPTAPVRGPFATAVFLGAFLGERIRDGR